MEDQLLLMQYPSYVGTDISPKAIEICREKFSDDNTKKFYTTEDFIDAPIFENFDMSISLDVIYHLIENSVFRKYMKNLFRFGRKFVCIYSSNTNENYHSDSHVRHRSFLKYVNRNFREWKLIDHIKNKHPYNEQNPNFTSFADFYFFEKENI